MINILRDPIGVDALVAILKKSPRRAILPVMGDAAWTRVRGNAILKRTLENLCARALAECEVPLPMLTDELYADYSKTGTRIRFESVYFERRRQLARAAIAVLVEEKGGRREQFAGSLQRKMEEVFGETSWALPAHVGGHPSGKDVTVIDLFFAETANLFGELVAIFADVLPEEFKARVRRRLRAEIFENYLAREYFWMNRDSNWNAVCHQGVLGAAMAVEEDAELLGRMLHRAIGLLPRFLEGYGSDGATTEGPGYWSYGFGWFCELNAQLEHRSGGELSCFQRDDKIAAMARFGPLTLLENAFTLNFSDGSATSWLRPALLQYLADRLEDPLIAGYAGAAWQNREWEEKCLDDPRGDFFFFSRLCLRCPTKASGSHPLPMQDIYWQDAQWVMSRSRGAGGHLLEFAAKAGHNGENHNHNDVGSYLLNVDGQRALIEIGAPEYTRDFFLSSKRYENIAARSLGHSLPLVNGKEQAEGEVHGSRVMDYLADAEEVLFSLDFTAAYPGEAGLVRGERQFVLSKKAGVLRVVDTFELARAEALETALICLRRPTIEKGTALLKLDGVSLKIQGDDNTIVHEVQEHAYRDHGGRVAVIFRLVLVPRELGPVLRMAYDVRVD